MKSVLSKLIEFGERQIRTGFAWRNELTRSRPGAASGRSMQPHFWKDELLCWHGTDLWEQRQEHAVGSFTNKVCQSYQSRAVGY